MDLELDSYICSSETAEKNKHHVVDVQTGDSTGLFCVKLKCIHCGKEFSNGSALFLSALYTNETNLEERHRLLVQLLVQMLKYYSEPLKQTIREQEVLLNKHSELSTEMLSVVDPKKK